jgi:antirestriction protein
MISIFITDLQAYNEGFLSGKWIRLPLAKDKLSEAIYEVLREGELASGSESHEEVFITDYEAEILIGEYDDIYRLNELAEAMEEYSDDDLLKFKFLIHEGFNEREVIDNGVENYDVDIYDYSSDTSFTDVYELLAQDMVEEGLFGCVPPSFENYIDYSAIGRDLSYDYTEFEDGILGRVA